MGRCSSTPSEGGPVQHQEISPLLEETSTHAKASAMGEGQRKTDFNHYLDATNVVVAMAKEKFERSDELKKDNYELKRLNEELKKENESLRKRYVFVNYIIFLCSRTTSSGTDDIWLGRHDSLLPIGSLLKFMQMLSYLLILLKSFTT